MIKKPDDALSKLLAYVDSPFKLFAVILMAALAFGGWVFYENQELIVGTYKESQKLPSIAEDRVDDAAVHLFKTTDATVVAIFKALEEYKHRKKISDEEYQLRIDFIKKYGTKEWQKLIDIKAEIEKLEKEDRKYFDAELAKVKWVQFWCFLAAGWIAYFIVWGGKK